MRLWLRAALFLILLGLPSSALAQTTNYPGSVDDTSTLCDPTPTAQTNGACKAAENAAAQNHAIIGLEDKVGTGASTPQAGYLLEGTGTGTSAYTAPGTAITPAPTSTPIPPVATATPIPAVATATPEAQAFDFTTATPVAGCVLYDAVGGGTSSVVSCATVLPSSTPASTATPRPTDTPIPAPTAYPTLAVGEIVVGTGGQGVQDGKAALTTATPIAAGFLYDSLGGAGSVISYVTAVPTATIIATATPRATDTPAPTATPGAGCTGYPCGSGLTVLGPTFASADTTMASSATWYTAVTLGTALTNGKTYEIDGSALILDAVGAGTAGATATCELYDSTNGVAVVNGAGSEYLTSGAYEQITLPKRKYTGFVGTPTMILRCRSSDTNSVITASAVGGTAHLAVSIEALEAT